MPHPIKRRKEIDVTDQFIKNKESKSRIGSLEIKSKFELTDKQRTILRALLDKNTKACFIDGLYGSSKSYLCVMAGLIELNKGNVDEIIYCRNPIEANSNQGIGFLAGSQKEKMAPYAQVFFSKISEFMSEMDLKYLEDEEFIKVLPIGFSRGLSLARKVIIVDEASSMSYDDIFLILTRCGPDTKIFFAGDSQNQSDIGNRSGFLRMIRCLNDQESRDNGIFHFEMKEESDIVRSPFVKFIMKKTGLIKSITD